MLPDFGPQADAAVKAAIALFPATFGLRAYPEQTFRVAERASFVSRGEVVLYTQRLVTRDAYLATYGNEPKSPEHLWLDFAKGSVADLQAQVVVTVDATLTAQLTAIATASEHEPLGIDASTLTSQRADEMVSRCKVHTTTELLLLLARFHADVDDTAGAEALATFAASFATLESKVV